MAYSSSSKGGSSAGGHRRTGSGASPLKLSLLGGRGGSGASGSDSGAPPIGTVSPVRPRNRMHLPRRAASRAGDAEFAFGNGTTRMHNSTGLNGSTPPAALAADFTFAPQPSDGAGRSQALAMPLPSHSGSAASLLAQMGSHSHKPSNLGPRSDATSSGMSEQVTPRMGVAAMAAGAAAQQPQQQEVELATRATPLAPPPGSVPGSSGGPALAAANAEPSLSLPDNCCLGAPGAQPLVPAALPPLPARPKHTPTSSFDIAQASGLEPGAAGVDREAVVAALAAHARRARTSSGSTEIPAVSSALVRRTNGGALPEALALPEPAAGDTALQLAGVPLTPWWEMGLVGGSSGGSSPARRLAASVSITYKGAVPLESGASLGLANGSGSPGGGAAARRALAANASLYTVLVQDMPTEQLKLR